MDLRIPQVQRVLLSSLRRRMLAFFPGRKGVVGRTLVSAATGALNDENRGSDIDHRESSPAPLGRRDDA